VLGQHTTCQVDAILCTGKHMLLDTDATHHSTDITVAAIWPPALQALHQGSANHCRRRLGLQARYNDFCQISKSGMELFT
jgi:hypothetical protein